MEKPGEEQGLPVSNAVGSSTVASFAELLPALYYGVNRVLDVCAPAVSRKVIVVLWALAGSGTDDKAGKYLTTPDIAKTFRDWFVVSEGNVSSEVSKVKRELFDLNYIKTEGGHDHIHLTDDGQKAMRDAVTKATSLLQETLGVLKPGEQVVLADFAKRMLTTMRKGPQKEGQPENADREVG